MKEQCLSSFGLKRNSFIGLSLFFGFLLFANSVFGQAPTITSFSPTSAKPGESITIVGTGFNVTGANNKVFFGSVEAAITAASATSLTVTVPVGVTTDKISISNLGTNLAVVSNRTFLARFSSASLASSYNTTPVDFSTGTQGGTEPSNTAGAGSQYVINDINGDGKPDILSSASTVSVLHLVNNTSQSSSVVASNFTTRTSTVTGRNSSSMLMADFNGDGKLDVLSGEVGQNGKIYTNTSSNTTTTDRKSVV